MAKGTIDAYFSPKASKRLRPSLSAEAGDGNGSSDVALVEGVDRMREATVRARRLASHARDCWLEKESDGRVPPLRDMLLEEGWKRSLDSTMSSSTFKRLEAFVEKEWMGNKPIYPPAPCVFHAFHSCTLEEIKVVILGQDPYHGAGQAMGLSFSVPRGQRVPPSLQNIYKEIHEDLGIPRGMHGDLTRWAQQGVFMLNAVMTVRSGEANSHAKRGWEEFTDDAIRIISKERTGVVFLLWGRHAQAKERLIDTKKHHILKAAHPSGLSAHKGFFGCKHFSKTNAILRSKGETEIDWSIA